MKIGILGSGMVGGQLAKAFAAHGHEIMISSRSPNAEKIQVLLTEVGHGAIAGTIEATVAFGEIITIALSWSALPDAIKNVGDWHGKIVIDATNRFGNYASGKSAAQDLADILTGAYVVKAFNTIGAEHYTNPIIHGEQASMLIAGDNAKAKEVVGGLVKSLGFDLVDAGPLGNATLLENLAQLWVNLMRSGMGRDIAFKLIH